MPLELFVPVNMERSAGMSSNFSIAIINTSVSGEEITILSFVEFACNARVKILVSAPW